MPLHTHTPHHSRIVGSGVTDIIKAGETSQTFVLKQALQQQPCL